jgi:hypothetical protein
MASGGLDNAGIEVDVEGWRRRILSTLMWSVLTEHFIILPLLPSALQMEQVQSTTRAGIAELYMKSSLWVVAAESLATYPMSAVLVTKDEQSSNWNIGRGVDKREDGLRSG